MYHSFGTNPGVAENVRRVADGRSFAEAISEELENRVEPSLYPYAYVGRGLYAEQIENYYRVFDEDRLLVIDFHRLQNELGSVLHEVTDFLGLPPFTEQQCARLASESHNVGLPREKSPEDERTLQRLREHFHEPNQRLKKLLGWNINW
jgi:DNA-binding transcriptional MerR regulator